MRNGVYLGHRSLEYTFIFYIHCRESSPKMGGHFWELITPSGGFWKKYWHNLSRKENTWTEAATVQQLQGPDQIGLPGSHVPGKAPPAPCAGHRHRTRAHKKQRQQKRHWVWLGFTSRVFEGLSQYKGGQNPNSPHFHWPSTLPQKIR